MKPDKLIELIVKRVLFRIKEDDNLARRMKEDQLKLAKEKLHDLDARYKERRLALQQSILKKQQELNKLTSNRKQVS